MAEMNGQMQGNGVKNRTPLPAANPNYPMEDSNGQEQGDDDNAAALPAGNGNYTIVELNGRLVKRYNQPRWDLNKVCNTRLLLRTWS